MKKFISFLLISFLFFNSVSIINTKDSVKDSIGVIINGRNISLDASPLIVSNQVFVPMRKIFEKMGANVTFDGKSKTIHVSKNRKNMILQVNNNQVTISGKKSNMNAAPIIMNSQLFIPICAISETLNAKVEWNDVLNKVIIFDWDSISNIVAYDKCKILPDFGKYTGLECTDAESSNYQNINYYTYTYVNNLGYKKSAIMNDYAEVLSKNGFLHLGWYPIFCKVIENNGDKSNHTYTMSISVAKDKKHIYIKFQF